MQNVGDVQTIKYVYMYIGRAMSACPPVRMNAEISKALNDNDIQFYLCTRVYHTQNEFTIFFR